MSTLSDLHQYIRLCDNDRNLSDYDHNLSCRSEKQSCKCYAEGMQKVVYGHFHRVATIMFIFLVHSAT